MPKSLQEHPMRRASLYAAVLFAATPALALSPEAADRLQAEAAGDMTRIVFHDAPKPVFDGVFEGPDGAETGFDAWPGKVVLVNFWATWCPPCLKEMPAIDRLSAEMEGDAFEVVVISTDRGSRDKPARWLDENGIETLELYHDPRMAAARSAGLLGQPTTLILDRAGREIARYQGEAEWDSAEAKALIEAVIAETE
jgi:thiol-disulfide isomerase/thioredoxin